MRLRAAPALGVLALVVAAGPAPATPAARPQARILYAGDWTGSMQIFAVDPAGKAPLRQVTFARPDPCRSPAACGFTRPLPSPDGRWLAYFSAGAAFDNRTLWLARADGTGTRAIGPALGAAWAPDSRRLAYGAADGIHGLSTAGGDRIVDRHATGQLRFSPDGKPIAFLGGAGLTLLRNGHERILARNVFWAFDWSPDGRRIAYLARGGIRLLDLATGRPRLAYRISAAFYQLADIGLTWSPDGRHLAFALLGTIRVLDTQKLRTRTLARDGGHDLAWSPDGRSILYVQGSEDPNGDQISTGDVRTVTLSGHVRVVVAASKPYGGQIVAAAWATPAAGVRYRAPEPVDGVFAGGPVQEIAADGSRVAFVACGGVSAWTPSTGAVTAVENALTCRATYSRGHVYSLGIAGDRVVWLEKGWGLCFQWEAREATLGVPAVVLGRGYGCLGGPPLEGTGTAVGAGSLLVLSTWKLRPQAGSPGTDLQTIERVEPGGCPCPALSSSPGPYTPLDVDAGRIVVSGDNETRILSADGTVLLALPVPTLAAQLSGSDLVLAAGDQLRVYDAGTGVLRAAWPLPGQPAGHDCDYYGDPSCRQPVRLTLGGLARGLAAYVIDGQVHLLRLADGADTLVGPGTLARFMDSGLVYADGARIRLVPFARLPL